MSDHDAHHGHERHPAHLEFEQQDVYSKYMLHSKSEIAFVLRNVLQKGSLITVYFNHGQSFLLTALLAINPDNGTLLFDMGSDEEMNQAALKADRLLFTTSLDKVKVQFSLGSLLETTYQGRRAFRGSLPDMILRLQRREYYRLTTPVANPIRCRMTARHEDGAVQSLDIPLLDISGGGVGLIADPALREDLAIGREFSDCRIELLNEGLLVCNLIVRNAFDVTTKSGNHHLRVGCEFVDLPGTRLTMVQRYITHVERERKARMSGME